MSFQSYQIPAANRQVELEVKRSKFLTFVGHAQSRESAEAFIGLLRKQHPQANHVCWAYIAGSPNSTIRSMSDDGEPSGTAGMPMLKILEHSQLGEVVVAVVRYFGGTKLGTGGLQRAYSEAVAQVLVDLEIQTKVDRKPIHLAYDYVFEKVISHLLSRYDVENIEVSYAGNITLSLAIAHAQLEAFKAELSHSTAGKVELKLLDEQ